MKIRCGSHQQNRSIVRPGLSLMATKVALTAEEFRENSQRSIDLFNTEKLSTDSTHVLKSAYCNSVHFCRCNLHGACGGKGGDVAEERAGCVLQSARSVWRQRLRLHPVPKSVRCCNLHGACGGKGWTRRKIRKTRRCNLHGACGGKEALPAQGSLTRRLQSARSVWRQSVRKRGISKMPTVAICTERVEAKRFGVSVLHIRLCCNLHGACGGKDLSPHPRCNPDRLQSARSVWRQS